MVVGNVSASLHEVPIWILRRWAKAQQKAKSHFNLTSEMAFAECLNRVYLVNQPRS